MTLSSQFLTMLAMIGMGSFFGAALDTYGRFLKRSKRKNWVVICNDILFWILQALIIFYVLYLVNRGELRFYVFMALLCGFAAYQSLLRSGYLKVLELAVRMSVSIYQFIVKVIVHMIYRPLYALVMTIISIIFMLGKGLLILVRFLLKVLLLLLRLILKPFRLISLIIWNILPKGFKKTVRKSYNKIKGFTGKLKNYFNSAISAWKNRVSRK